MTRFRLKIDDWCVGYLEIDKNNQNFYSKDMYGWTSQPIEYLQKDQCVGFKDRNNQLLFESDKCYFKSDSKTIYELVYDKNKWWLKNIASINVIEVEMSISYFKQIVKLI